MTAVTYNPDNGKIYDADVEINSENVNLTLSDDAPEFDLDSIITHEAGHFLGLFHSNVGVATMFKIYSNGDTEMRSLAPDDEQGICAVYPPNAEAQSNSCTPRHGFSGECQTPDDKGCCSTAPGRRPGCGCPK